MKARLSYEIEKKIWVIDLKPEKFLKLFMFLPHVEKLNRHGAWLKYAGWQYPLAKQVVFGHVG